MLYYQVLQFIEARLLGELTQLHTHSIGCESVHTFIMILIFGNNLLN